MAFSVVSCWHFAVPQPIFSFLHSTLLLSLTLHSLSRAWGTLPGDCMWWQSCPLAAGVSKSDWKPNGFWIKKSEKKKKKRVWRAILKVIRLLLNKKKNQLLIISEDFGVSNSFKWQIAKRTRYWNKGWSHNKVLLMDRILRASSSVHSVSHKYSYYSNVFIHALFLCGFYVFGMIWIIFYCMYNN